MARYIGGNNNAEPVLEAIDHWKTASLLSDNGIFEDREVWNTNYLQKLDSIIEQIDNKGFYPNFNIQLEKSGVPEIIQLAAEICWFVHLCPSYTGISPSKKRDRIKNIWKLSNASFPENSKWLKDDTLKGIGSSGTFFRTNQKKEWKLFIRFTIAFKTLPRQERGEHLKESNCWKFAEWLDGILESGNPTLRHMILFLLFPDNFERIFSTYHREEIVSKFKGEAGRKLSPVEIDHLLLEIRREKEKEHGTSELDFYNPPLNEWQNKNTEEPKESDGEIGKNPSTKKMSGDTMNLILYGPPGTGKTYWLSNLTKEYSGKKQIPLPETLSKKQDQTRKNWLRQEFESSAPQWLSIIIGVLYLETKATLAEISKHEYARIIEPMTKSKTISSTIYTELREHAAQNSEVVPRTPTYKYRPPFVFDQDSNKRWYLVNDWEEKCGENPKWREHVELAKKWKAGPNQEAPDERSEEKPDHELHGQRFEFVTFHQAYGYEDFVEGIRPVIDKETGNVKYEVVPGVFKRICQRAKSDPGQQYAIFIDEINRGNIANIFGELITLLETDKRVIYGQDGLPKSGIGMTLTLPYSGEQFGVPVNLDVFGTMNTADRSIALLDTALRRRFQFKELMPDASLIKGSQNNGHIEDGEGGSINLRALLEAINNRIRFLLSRDMTIGHSYLINVRDFSELKNALLSRIIPLLQEYFYDDWHRIQLVFRDVKTGGEKPEPREPQIIKHKILEEKKVIGFDHDDFEDSTEYRVAPEDEITPDAIRKIYEEND